MMSIYSSACSTNVREWPPAVSSSSCMQLLSDTAGLLASVAHEDLLYAKEEDYTL
jgi:hypothetical protein